MIEVAHLYRDLKTHKEPWRVKVHVQLRGSGTLGELMTYLHEEHSEADLESLHIAPTFVSYYLEPTQADLDERAAWLAQYEARNKERIEAWQRKTYAELKAKFEPEEKTGD